MSPEDSVDPIPTLGELLARGERDEDFKFDDQGKRLDTPRRTVDAVIDCLSTAVKHEKRRREITISTVQRVGTKVGLLRLRELPGSRELEGLYKRQLRRAIEDKDRMAFRFLETRVGFKFAHPVSRKTGISLYPWVATELDEAADMVGISSSQMLVATLFLGVATLPDWTDLLEDDIQEFKRHITRRIAVLKDDL